MHEIKNNSISILNKIDDDVIAETYRIAMRMGIPKDIRQVALISYEKASRKGFLKGRKKKLMLVASLYLACRASSFPRTIKDFSRFTGLDEKSLFQYITPRLRMEHLLQKEIEKYEKLVSLTIDPQEKAIYLEHVNKLKEELKEHV